MAKPITCQEALRKLFANPETYLARDAVYQALDKAYPNKPWTRGTIYLHLSFFSINNPLRKHHPKTEGKCFLFWDGDGGFRKWIPERDGRWILREDGIVRLEDGNMAEQPILMATPDPDDSTVARPSSLSIERDLEDSLVQNLTMLEPGLRLYRDGDVEGRQLDTATVGIIDLLAVDKNDILVVIELKAGKASDSVCGQILGYMAWVREELAGGKKVRGIIVASGFSDRLRYAAQAVDALSLIKYSIRFKFTDAT